MISRALGAALAACVSVASVSVAEVAAQTESSRPVAASAQTPSARADFEKWLGFILPAPDELSWRKIPWRHEFGIALLLAKQQNRPVLLWAMNGHPLGCT